MLAALAEFRFLAERVDLVAHLVEGAVDALALGFDILGHDLVDLDPRLVEHRVACREALHQCQSLEHIILDMRNLEVDRPFAIDQFLVRDQFRQDHGGGLQRLDLDFLVAARIDMLDAQYAHSAFAVDDRHTGKRVELFLPRLGAIGEVGVGLGLGQVERFDIVGDGPGQAFAHGQPRDVDGFGIQALRRIQLQRAFTQQVDRADLARQALGDDLDHAVEFVLCMGTPGHDLVQARKYLAGGSNCGHASAYSK